MVFPEKRPNKLNIMDDITPLKNFNQFIVEMTNLYVPQDKRKVNTTTTPFDIKARFDIPDHCWSRTPKERLRVHC